MAENDPRNVPLTCEGITALVTGASRGLGREIAEALVSAGASVVLVARSREDLHRAKGHVQTLLRAGARAHCIAADLSSPSFEAGLEKELKKAGLQPDVLVNNAAVQGPIGPFWETDWQEWSQSFQLNAFAPARLCRLLIPGMIARGWGKIITLSGGGATAPRPRFTAYGAAKTLLVRLMETLAEELKPHAIDANAIAPGAMKSAMTDAVIAAGPAKAGEKEYESAKKLLQGTDEVVSRAARLCVFLSSHASDGITGKLLSAAWDPWESLPSHREDLARTDVYCLRRIVPADRGLTWGSK